MSVDHTDPEFAAAVEAAVAEALAKREEAAREAALAAAAEVEAEQASQAAAREAADAEAAASAERWAGHTHDWGEPDLRGLVRCSVQIDGVTCPLILHADFLKESGE